MKLVAVCDEIEQKAEVAARRWSARSYYGDVETMLRKEQLQFLSVCTPPLAHTDIVCKALESGVNVICEKPLAMKTREVERMMAKASAGTAKLTMICNELYNPAVIRARRVLEWLHQQPNRVEFQMLRSPNDKLSFREHWSHNLPGGVFGEMMIHGIYVIRHFLGDLAVQSVRVDKRNEHGSMKHDELRASLRSGEKHGEIHISFNSPQHQVIMDLYGEKNSVRADLFTSDVFFLRNSDARYTAKAAEAMTQASVAMGNAVGIMRDAASYHLGRLRSSHEGNIRAFVDSVLNGTPPPLSLEDMHALVNTQEQITGLIDADDSP
jgi:predicted dehydrogenase